MPNTPRDPVKERKPDTNPDKPRKPLVEDRQPVEEPPPDSLPEEAPDVNPSEIERPRERRDPPLV